MLNSFLCSRREALKSIWTTVEIVARLREEQDKSSLSRGRDWTCNVELALTPSEALVEARFTFCCGPYG